MKLNDSNVTIMVANMDKAISFYESIGLTTKQRWGDHYAMLAGPGITLGIHPGGDKNSSSGTVSIGFMIDDFNEAKAHLDKLGISYEAQDDGNSGNYLHFKDLDGTILYYVKPKW
jgi:catechol 2,3-dioxygenase-like lactoylglutathione lyase family enzyme